MRGLLTFLHIAMIRVAGILCILSGYSIYSTITTWDPLPGEALMLIAPLGVCAIACLSPTLMRPLRNPRGMTDLVPVIFVAAVIPLAVILYNSPDPRLLPTLESFNRIGAALLAVPLLVTGLILVALPQSDVVAPQIVERRWIDGTPWRAYLITDFIAMRLFGLGMLCVGGVLWFLVQSEQSELATALSFGLPIQVALYGYCALGALMVLPVFLPAFLSVPKSPVEGVIKALFTLAVAVVLANAIAKLWPDAIIAASPIGLPSVLTDISVGSLVMAVQIIAAVTALLSVIIPLIRRAAGLRYDAEGRPLVTLSGEELRRLRAARAALN